MISVLFIAIMGFSMNSEGHDLTKIQQGNGEKPVLIFQNMISENHNNWHHFVGNPILRPEASYELWMDGGNLYAPAILKRGDQYWMWYGAQNRSGHDQIHLAFSDDGVNWSRYENNPVIPVEDANHVNDPTVLEVEGTFYMYYTCAPTTEMDRIHLATSTDGMNWEKRGEVIASGPIGTWDSLKVGRPSILYEDRRFKLWFDGTEADPENPDKIRPGTGRHIGFATSSDGIKFAKEPEPIYLNSGAIDIAHVGNEYIMLFESGAGTHWAAGTSETKLEYRGLLLPKSGESYDRYGQVTPMLLMKDGKWTGIYYGAAEGLPESGAANWNRNRIGAAFPQKSVELYSLSGEKIPAIYRALDRSTLQIELPKGFALDSLHLKIMDGEAALYDGVLKDINGGDIFRLD